MPTILAIETSAELASAALLLDDRVVTRSASGAQTHSQSLLPMVQQVLSEAGVTLAQCDAIGFGAGPGSFTGVRTACGTAQGLGFGADIPLVPVITLEAMAEACRHATHAENVLVVLDARMNEVYWAQYCAAGEGWECVQAPRLSAAALVQAQGEVVACGNGLSAYSAAFEDRLDFIARYPEIMPHAQYVAALAARALAAGQQVHPRDASPIYLRDKIALTTSERAAAKLASHVAA